MMEWQCGAMGPIIRCEDKVRMGAMRLVQSLEVSLVRRARIVDRSRENRRGKSHLLPSVE
jgi:hypothetical protein